MTRVSDLLHSTSPTLSPPSQPQSPVVIRRIHSPKSPHSQSAPFPSLPRALDIQNELLSIDTELHGLRAKLSVLQHERGFFSNLSSQFVNEFRNVLSPSATINAIQKSSRERAAAAHSRMPSFFVSKRLVSFPQFSENLSVHEEFLQPLFYAAFCKAAIVQEDRTERAKAYQRQRLKWLENEAKMSECLARVRPTEEEEWPTEFPNGTTKPEGAKTLALTAPDRPMLSKFERKEGLFWDMNRFVENPEEEHQRFKRRVGWTEKEKERFVEAYIQHPKKFRVIVRDLPGKSVGDAIEFYYLNRFSLGLKEKEPLSRRRGKAKVISEGTIKKEG
jgi:hypothetical protein